VEDPALPAPEKDITFKRGNIIPGTVSVLTC